MNSELKAAAERVRFTYDSERGGYRCNQPGNQDGEYIKVPADDGEPIDEAWLRSAKFNRKKCDGDVRCFAIGKPYCTLYVFEAYLGKDWWACVGKYRTAENSAGTDAHFDKRLKTRGDVRRLASALGIPLAEGGAK